MIRAAFSWFGGKYYHLRNILPHLPKKDLFVDVFGGSGVVVQNHSLTGVYNDLHPGLYLFFTCLKEEHMYKELSRLLTLTLYAREEWELAKDWSLIPDPVTSAAAFYVKTQQSFASNGSAWSRDKKERARGLNGYQTSINALDRLHKLWNGISLSNLSWQQCLKQYDSIDTTFYLDPPYICKSGNIYDYTMSENNHRDMILYIKKYVKGTVVISGYANPIYDHYRWDRRLVWNTIENTKQSVKEEVLWIKE